LINSHFGFTRAIIKVMFVLAVIAGVSACGSKEKNAGQSLVKVNGVEITLLQLNDELKHAGVRAEQQEAASKQLLESLIDRQLILAEAQLNKLDRTPEVVQAVERAKAQIIAQAYLKNLTSRIAKPTKKEINEYYQTHPEFFAKRKEFVLKQLIVDNKDFSEELRSFMNSARSLEDVSRWMDLHKIAHSRGQSIRSTADLPKKVVEKLIELPKGKLILSSEGNGKVLSLITSVTDSPISEQNASLQIEQLLMNKKGKEVVESELAHLRSVAKIEYLNASSPVADKSAASTLDKNNSDQKK